MKKALLLARLKAFRNDEGGQALVLVAVGLLMIMLIAGLGVDVGYLRYQHQQMQKAADAGALGAALVMNYNNTAGAIMAAGQNDAAANGFMNGTNNVSVQVYNPPPAGDTFAGNPNYVQVVISQPQPLFFMRVGGFTTAAVSARADAAIASASGCIYALDPTDSASFLVDGNVTINSTCGIVVDSSDGSALTKKGNSGQVTASSIGVVGGVSGSGFTPAPVTGIAPVDDPLRNVAEPSYAPGCDHLNFSTTSGATLQPGRYCNGITITGNGTTTFASGTYFIIGGGIQVTGNATLIQSGSGGELFYLTQMLPQYSYGGVNMLGNSTATLSAMTTGPQAGILFFQDRNVPVGSSPSEIGGNNGSLLTGAIYFPTTDVTYHGNPAATEYSLLIAYTLEFKGNTTLTNSYASLPDGISPIHTANIVE